MLDKFRVQNTRSSVENQLFTETGTSWTCPDCFSSIQSAQENVKLSQPCDPCKSLFCGSGVGAL